MTVMSHVLMCVLSHHLIVLAKKSEVTAKQLSLLKTNKQTWDCEAGAPHALGQAKQ